MAPCSFRTNLLWVVLLLLGEGHRTARLTSSKRVQHDAEDLPKALALQPQVNYTHVSVKAVYHNLGEEIITFPERRPFTFNLVLATMKTWTADAIVQAVEKSRGKSKCFDWQRSLAFATFGFLYIGLLQWCLEVTLLTWLFPDAVFFANAPLAMKLQDRTGQAELVGQIMVDFFVFTLFIYFPVFYMVKELLQGSGSLRSRVQGGLDKYWRNIVQDGAANFALWIPAGFFIFSAPMFLRMPLEHAVSFIWTLYISCKRGSVENPKTEPEKTCEATAST